MTYEFKKSEKFPMEIVIDGQTYIYYVNEFTVNAETYAKCQRLVELSQKDMEKDFDEISKEFPIIVRDVCLSIFGDEITNALVDFSDGNLYELSAMLIPYLEDEFLESFKKIAQEKYNNKVNSLRPKKKSVEQ